MDLEDLKKRSNIARYIFLLDKSAYLLTDRSNSNASFLLSMGDLAPNGQSLRFVVWNGHDILIKADHFRISLFSTVALNLFLFSWHLLVHICFSLGKITVSLLRFILYFCAASIVRFALLLFVLILLTYQYERLIRRTWYSTRSSSILSVEGILPNYGFGNLRMTHMGKKFHISSLSPPKNKFLNSLIASY